MNVLTTIAEWAAPRAKAIAAALGSLVLLFIHYMPDGITLEEWAVMVTEALALMGVTYAIPNRPGQPPAEPARLARPKPPAANGSA